MGSSYLSPTTRSPSICGIVLAGGEASRMSQDKALLPWPSGRAGGVRDTLLGAWIQLLRPHAEMVIVVGGKNSPNLAPVVYSMGASLIENHAPELGRFSSLKLGLNAVLNYGRDSAIVALGDRPPVQPATLGLLNTAFLRALEQSFWAAMPEYDQQRGYPFIVSREMIEALLRAPLTTTEQDVIHANETHVCYVPVEDPRVVSHIETQEDYDRFALENT